jgi:hypothetical protein
MAPPGVPDFFSRARVVAPGTHRIVGKAGAKWMEDGPWLNGCEICECK